LLGYPSYTGPLYCLGVRSLETPFLSKDASSEVIRGDSVCVRLKEVLRETLDTNYEWGDKLRIMDMENKKLLVI